MDSSKRTMEDDQEPVLFKIDKENTPFSDIYINKNEFKIGRAKCSDEVIPDILISRNHAVLNCDENGDWTITHLSSTITLINDEPLEVGKPKKLNVGDVVQFSASPDYKYIFRLCPKSDQNRKRQKLNQCLMETVLTQQKSFAESQENKRKELEERLQTNQNEQIELKAKLDELLHKQAQAKEENQELNNKIFELQQQIKTGNDAEFQLKKSYDELLLTLEKERQKFEELLNDEKKKWQIALDENKQEKESIEKKMKEEMQKWREEQEGQWTQVMENLVRQEKSAQEKLLNEKLQLEQKLRETENALKEQAAITEQLQSTVENNLNLHVANNPIAECTLVQFIDDGTTGQMEILETIDLTTEDPSSSTGPNGTLAKVGDIMNDQLMCSICSEIFIKAVTLNCTHSFCHNCIVMWMRKKRECPVCRAPIISVNRSIVLDNFIEQMFENLSPQMRENRQQLLNERKGKEIPFVNIRVKRRR